MRRPATLRTRLLIVVLGLLALICLAVGTTTEIVLHHYLVGRVDAQLAGAVNRSSDAYGAAGPVPYAEPPAAPVTTPSVTNPGTGVPAGTPAAGTRGLGPAHDTDGTGPGGLHILGQTVGLVQAQYRNGSLLGQAQQLGPASRPVDLDAGQTSVLASVRTDGQPVTKTLPGLGDYRLVTSRETNGDVIVTGLPLGGVNDTVLRLGLVELAVMGAGLLVAGVAGASILRVTLRPLRRVAATATRVTELELDRGEVALADRVPEADTDPRTEVGQVGAALNALLGHVDSALTARQASETRVRQFVADASHELRTPLAAIRGYAELTRRNRAQSPPDVAHALARVESEAQRMTSMVEDLLLLARLDSGRPLDVAPVDLTSMVIDAVSDAHAAGPDHDWRVELPDEAVVVPGDGQRLHQVLTNLLANARVHTPAGTPVTVGLRHLGDRALLTVTDEGPGVPAELAPTVFERFARGDSSRSRAAGSTGLGLAIVSAVVGAHHGDVTLDSRPGRTVFTVSLPA